MTVILNLNLIIKNWIRLNFQKLAILIEIVNNPNQFKKTNNRRTKRNETNVKIFNEHPHKEKIKKIEYRKP